MQLVVRGRNLPGRRFPRSDGGWYDNVHVALQVRSDAVDRVPGDAGSAEWSTTVDVVERDGQRDFRGPAVHGRRGERFLYLTWGCVDGDAFDMFRRAKLMLDEAPPPLPGEVRLVATVSLTDERGWPRCARVRTPAIEWSWAT